VFAGLLRDQRRRAHHALESLLDELPVKRVSTGAGLVDDAYAARFGLQALAQAINIGFGRPDLAEQFDVA
jgi:hypothetical protein